MVRIGEYRTEQYSIGWLAQLREVGKFSSDKQILITEKQTRTVGSPIYRYNFIPISNVKKDSVVTNFNVAIYLCRHKQVLGLPQSAITPHQHSISIFVIIKIITSDIPHMFTIKVQVIRNTAHRPSTQASYTIGSGTTMQENQPEAQIAAKLIYSILQHSQY